MSADKKEGAYVVAASMGYGHERAAYAMRNFAVGRRIILANDYKGIPKSDINLWSSSRNWYERISRFERVPVLGGVAFALMDHFQRIEPFYPRRDLSRPSLQVRQTYGLIRRAGWCEHLIRELSKKPLPLVCTFATPAFAAEEFNYPGDIYLVLCDTDVSRGWVPLNPAKTRIKFLAPTGRVAERLALYGVPPKNIFLTGFPLPMEAVGGVEAEQAVHDLSRRLCHLDPQAIFFEHANDFLEAKMGPMFCENLRHKKSKSLHLTFAIGGAGAQREMAIQIAKSLAQNISSSEVELTLVAGTRADVADYLNHQLRVFGLGDLVLEKKVNILAAKDRREYFTAFNALMMTTDILWTKPSELSFFAGLGIPLLMAPPLGSQEEFNRQWLFQVGAGVDALDPRYTNEWLFDWIKAGAFARLAWNGFVNAPTHGAYRIEDLLFGRPLAMHKLPLVV